MNESAVKPMVTMRPATPASDRRKPMRHARMQSARYVSTAITASDAMITNPSAR
nr:hypothetical protein GCM10025699_26680 [Microbacterium flavescens]